MTKQATNQPEAVLENIPVKALTVSDNVRGKLSGIPDLAASICSVGLLNPITVHLTTVIDEEGEGDIGIIYEVIAGHRRLAAVKRLGWDTIPALVHPATDNALFVAASLVENLQRDDLNPMEEAQGLYALVAHAGSQKEAAALIGSSAGHVSKRLKLLDLPDVGQDAVADGRLNVTDAFDISKLDTKAQDRVIKRYESDVHPRTVRSHLDSELADAVRAKESRKAARAVAKLKKHKKTTVVARPDMVKKWKSIEGYQGLDVDWDSHAKEPCHRLVVGYQGSWSGEISEEGFCAEPSRHDLEGVSDVKLVDESTTKKKHDDDVAERRAKLQEEQDRWKAAAIATATQLTDRNAALKVLSRHVLTELTYQELGDFLTAVGHTIPIEAADSGAYSYEGQKTKQQSLLDIVDGLTVAKLYRCAVLAVTSMTAQAPWPHVRQERDSRVIAALLGLEPEPEGE